MRGRQPSEQLSTRCGSFGHIENPRREGYSEASSGIEAASAMNHIATHLRDIFFGKKTGSLIFRRGEILKYFFFEKGTVFQVRTNQPDERLGEILCSLERIPKEVHARIDEFIEPNKNIGEVLKTQGVISEDDLAEALAH